MASQESGDQKPDPGNLRSDNSGRNLNRKGWFKGKSNQYPTIQKFKGETEDLEGHVYDVGNTTQAEQFTETTTKIASYAGRNCKEPQDICCAIEELKDIPVSLPIERPMILNDKLRAKLYEKDIEIWSKRESLYRQKKSSMYSVALGQ